MNRSKRRTHRLPLRAFGAGPALLALALSACTGGNQTPPPGGPQAVINSPTANSLTAGTFFFSVQPLDASQVAKVSFTAGGAPLGTDTDPADGYRVFVAAPDHPAGELKLTAVVTGKDGRTTTLTRTVTNVPAPPAAASVASNGAVLGTREADGSLSTLTVPPGSVPGATVEFAAMTKAEVKAATGVDYDALGITFLGAQDITTSQPFDRTLGVSSGGFGPAVQPQQAVVNYLIGPDTDGDGIGEIFVVNTASVAPNGDVVADPVPVPLIGRSATVSETGRSSLAPLATGLSGAPGAVIELPVAGFNPSAVYGSLAVFESGGATVERYGRIYTSAAGAQTFVVQVPPLAAGAATLTLHNLGSGYASDPIDLRIAPAASVTGAAPEVIDATLDLAADMLAALDAKLAGTGSDSAVAAGQPFIDTVRGNVAVMVAGGRPEDAAALEGLAARIVASGVNDLLADVHAELTTGPAYAAMQQGSCNDILDRADKGIEMVGDLTDLAGYDPPAGDTVADMHSYAFSEWWAWVKRTTLGIDEALGGNACRPDKPSAAGPGGKATPSGMGAAVPAGGNLGGSAVPPNFRPIPPYLSGPQPMVEELARGRFLISVSVSGSAVPFKGTSDASGYFMVPMIPTGQPFTAVALDTLTGENRVQHGVGPALEDGYFMVFDFSEGESQYSEARWDGDAGDGLWLSPTNWVGDSLPLPNNDIVIPAGAGTVVLNNYSGEASKVSVHSLTVAAGATLELRQGTLEVLAASTLAGDLLLTDGTLKALAPLVLDGDTTWDSGKLAGPAAIVNRGAISIDADATNSRTVSGPLRNEGTIVLSGTTAGDLSLESTASIVNAAGATFEIRGAPGVIGSTDVPFDNHGLLLKSSGAGTSSWNAAAVNHLGGTVQVQAGTLDLQRGGTSTGATWEVAAGAKLTLGAHTVVTVLGGTYAGSGAGVVVLAGGERFEIAAAGATFTFSGGGIEWHGSKITGPGTLTNAGVMRIRRDGGVPRLEGSIVNLGTLELSGSRSGGLSNANGASIDNRSGAAFALHDDQGIASASVPLTLTNGGHLAKVGGVGTSTIKACFVDTGGSVDPGIVFDSPASCG